jgi:hypothetical protein
MLILAAPDTQELAHHVTETVSARIGLPLQHLTSAQSGVSLEQHLETEDCGMGVSKKQGSTRVQLFGIPGHELAAMVDSVCWLIFGAVCERVQPDQPPALCITEGIVQGVQFTVCYAVAGALLEALGILAPSGVIVTGNITYIGYLDGTPEQPKCLAVPLFASDDN